jgi:hypothetical protein
MVRDVVCPCNNLHKINRWQVNHVEVLFLE